MTHALICIGASLGGLQALRAVLAALPKDYRLPVAVVQHRTPDAGDSLAVVLQESTPLTVQEATDKAPIEAGNVYLAPAGYHLLVEGDHFALSTEDPVLYAQPSIDVLFDTAAAACGARTVGVVLTGTGRDGAAGAAAIQRAGGMVVVESPATAQEGEMPQGALDATKHAVQLPLEKIGPYLAGLAKRK